MMRVHSSQTTIQDHHPPRLLVSVRSPAEARAAIEGGADIIDVKDPANGALGMASMDTIHAIADEVRSNENEANHSLGMSVALGELKEDPKLTSWQNVLGALPSTVRYVKIGLSGFGRFNNRWQGELIELSQSNPLIHSLIEY